ncbi:multidrug efflux SMR transporter [uncultured Vagococcus sp.]|uniref:DMT family transporter n=1 Tax=uncultured Vagococcus sp. TaxID=189676 RepID=UPI0028D8D257|nr:multidrug efflux SMR transporter [uncultured Vagococcus sp.]
MAWMALVAAGLFEMVGVSLINKFNLEKNAKSLCLLIGAFGVSFILLSYAMDSLAMGTAYAVWTGIGASGGAVLGMLIYGESKDIKRILCIGLILGAAIGLKIIS